MPQRSTKSINLGVDVLHAVTPPGICLSLRDIADVCDCSWQSVHRIEQKALRKIRAGMRRKLKMSYGQFAHESATTV